MSPGPERSPEYVEARRVLLDALEALHPQREALVLAGAQAVYLRTGPDSLPIAEYTTDGDLALDPLRLADAPPLPALMEKAGFTLENPQGSAEPGIWRKQVTINGVETNVPIDLIVPTGAAAPAGTRGARLGPHGKRAARKAAGLEAALLDNDPMTIPALDPSDRRSVRIRVAGVPALLVAKAHKLHDRIESGRANRIDDKDAADVLRLIQRSSPVEVAETLARLLDDPRTEIPVRFALGRLQELFGNRAGVGIEMAARALRGAMPAERVRTVCLAYCESLRSRN